MVRPFRAGIFASEWISAPSNMTVAAVLTVILTLIMTVLIRRLKFVYRLSKLPSLPGALPLLGNALWYAKFRPDEIFALTAVFRYFGPIQCVWAGPNPVVILTSAKAFETVLSSNKLIEKSREYDYLHPWLGTGLLTSTGSKWQSRRKLLTPSFHFKILDDFIQVFNEQTTVLIQQLEKSIKAEKDINIFPFITRCTLDVICETAMGCHVSAQTQTDSEYVRAVYAIGNVVQKRQFIPWLQPDILFHLSSYGATQRKGLKILHGFTDKVIKERKMEHKQKVSNKTTDEGKDDDFNSTKRKLAFLDLLIDASEDGKVLSDSDIREEVDTFMFEGHDTTTAGINWALHLIGSNPHVQEQVNEELDRVFGGSDRFVTSADLTELKYLECCIKEALRLYPPVPIMARKLCEDTVIEGYEVPADATVVLQPYSLHRDPKNFPEPELFKPERFFPENSRGRHPYAYVPFSAGPRNCIGQKFAMMEEKVILSTILRRFHIESVDKREEIVLLGELILRPRDGIRLRLTPKPKSS